MPKAITNVTEPVTSIRTKNDEVCFLFVRVHAMQLATHSSTDFLVGRRTRGSRHGRSENQALEGEKASLRADLEDRYASASEELQALSTEKRIAEAACSELRAAFSNVRESAAIVESELKVIAVRYGTRCMCTCRSDHCCTPTHSPRDCPPRHCPPTRPRPRCSVVFPSYPTSLCPPLYPPPLPHLV